MSTTQASRPPGRVVTGLLVILVIALRPIPARSQPQLRLAADGQARLHVRIRSQAAPAIREAAMDLAETLTRITDAVFEVTEIAATADSANDRGILVGLTSSFPDLPFETPGVEGTIGRDQYLLQTTDSQLYLLGTTPQAVHCAVWDFLHRLGYRLFFLTDTWEVLPHHPQLTVAMNATVRPDFVTRQAPRGAPWSDRDLWARWHRRNRMLSSFTLSTGHAYGGIVRRNRQAFDAHPEYFALVGDGRPTGANAKFCVSNAGLRQLVIDDAVTQITAHPEHDSVSMDPSDGGGWCECDACRELGSISDRALILANEVAAAINQLDMGDRYVGMYGYNEHSPPPKIEAHPNVVVSIATAFIRGGYTIEELVSGWQRQNAVTGIRDYHDVFAWSHDLPRSARGGNIDYLTRTIPWFHEHGSRFMNSENMDSWGANGLGYWLTPQLLLDVEQAQNIDALIEDFLDNAFGAAKEPMRIFYHIINRDHGSVRSHEDVVARLYRRLDEARTLTDDPHVTARLDDLILYTRYLELYGSYRNAEGTARQQGFEQVWKHAYRMKDRMMLSTVALCERDRFRDRSVQVPDDTSSWESSEPFDSDDITRILAAGISANQPTVLDFESVTYSDDLISATQLNLTPVVPGRYDNRGRGRQSVFTWFPENQRQIAIDVTGGLIRHYRNRGNVKFSLYSPKEVTLSAVDRNDSTPPDGNEYQIVLRSPYSGLHRLEWNDGSDRTQVVLPSDMPLTFRSTLEEPMRLGGRWDLYFYVPRGTRIVGGYTDSTRGTLLDGNNTMVFDFSTMQAAGYFSIPVPDGQDGTLWKFSDSRGSRMLMTVPPYLATSVETLLLPREVIEADRSNGTQDTE